MRLVVGKTIPYGLPSSTTTFTQPIGGAGIVSDNDSRHFNPSYTSRDASKVVFDSWNYDYWSRRETVIGGTSLPYRQNQTRTVSTWWGLSSTTYPVFYSGQQTYIVYSHYLNYIPVVLGFDETNNQILGTGTILVNGDSFRILTLSVDETNVYLHEKYYVNNYSLPSLDLTIKFLTLDQGLNTATNQNTSSYSFFATSDRVILGKGKLDTFRKYITLDGNSPYRIHTTESISIKNSISYTYSSNDAGWFYGYMPIRADFVKDGQILARYQSYGGIYSSDTPNVSGNTIGLNLL